MVGVPGFWARHEVGYLGLESEFYRKASLRHTNVIIANNCRRDTVAEMSSDAHICC